MESKSFHRLNLAYAEQLCLHFSFVFILLAMYISCSFNVNYRHTLYLHRSAKCNLRHPKLVQPFAYHHLEVIAANRSLQATLTPHDPTSRLCLLQVHNQTYSTSLPDTWEHVGPQIHFGTSTATTPGLWLHSAFEKAISSGHEELLETSVLHRMLLLMHLSCLHGSLIVCFHVSRLPRVPAHVVFQKTPSLASPAIRNGCSDLIEISSGPISCAMKQP